MDLSSYFEPIKLEVALLNGNDKTDSLYKEVDFYNAEHFPSMEGVRLVVAGVADDRAVICNKGTATACDQIRSALYALKKPSSNWHITDLGNFKIYPTVEETYAKAAEAVAELISKGITLVVIGGSQDFNYAIYKGYSRLGRIINMCCVDSMVDIMPASKAVNERSFVSNIILDNPSYLFDCTFCGIQTYLVGHDMLKLVRDMKLESYRLGSLQADMDRCEPIVRNSDFVTFDIRAVRCSDAPGSSGFSPHGFYGEQYCQISRFAGLSDKTSCVAFQELNPVVDDRQRTVMLTAHAIWYFFEGFYNRIDDRPDIDKKNHKRYIVQMKDGMEIVFHKSKKTERWWIEVPCDSLRRKRYFNHILVPCNYSDYEQALMNEIPELWWHIYQKMND